jgi:hypothetical protein
MSVKNLSITTALSFRSSELTGCGCMQAESRSQFELTYGVGSRRGCCWQIQTNVWVTSVSGYCFDCPFQLIDQASVTYANLPAMIITATLHCFPVALICVKQIHVLWSQMLQVLNKLNCSTHI